MEFTYSTKLNKWSLARCQNVNFIYSLFIDSPARMEVIDDKPENPSMPALVVMRKDYLEALIAEKDNTSKEQIDRLLEKHLSIVDKLLDLTGKKLTKL